MKIESSEAVLFQDPQSIYKGKGWMVRTEDSFTGFPSHFKLCKAYWAVLENPVQRVHGLL